jgi:HD-GYP domain-containing protein (c-di-GMP phosphodiesterase class II)
VLLRERTERLDEVRRELDAVTSIAGHTVEMRDPYTAGHQRRVARLAVEIARDLGCAASLIDEIEGAAYLHDLGKVAVPAEILAKPARLSGAEYALVQQHPRAAYEILTSVRRDWPVAEMVLQHHERMDGSGYPAGLVGDEIELGARVLAVADVVEAMASHRPYRPACGESAAIEEISRNSGVLYDPVVVQGCIRVFERGFAFDADSDSD